MLGHARDLKMSVGTPFETSQDAQAFVQTPSPGQAELGFAEGLVEGGEGKRRRQVGRVNLERLLIGLARVVAEVLPLGSAESGLRRLLLTKPAEGHASLRLGRALGQLRGPGHGS